MKFTDLLDRAVDKNKSLLCVGLDVDLKRIPQKLLASEDPIFLFNRQIIDETKKFVCAYKPNIAFYEMYGLYGLSALVKTINHIHETTDALVILDAKRGDVGHSSGAYAKSIFSAFKADATTVSPYMGHDSVKPFLDYHEKGTFVLCLTSNTGFRDFQIKGTDEPLYKSVAKHVKEWNHYGNCGLVVGATKPEELKEVRELVGDLPLLIPGVGAQGGALQLSVKYGVNKKGKRAIINASRSIIYAKSPKAAAKKLKEQINSYR
jgi:orotidine 5'-phosphate decarboxylase subfamily 2